MSASTTMADLEAQTHTITGSHLPLPTPMPVLTHHSRAPPTEFNPMDDFFGYTLSSSRTHESRHDRTSLSDVPPPYVDDLPVYARKVAEPATLAQYLFKFGFLFPPFWIMGAIILLSPLRAPEPSSDAETPSWLPEKTEGERQQFISHIRAIELKWAKRCLYALIAFAFVAVIIAVATWTVLHS